MAIKQPNVNFKIVDTPKAFGDVEPTQARREAEVARRKANRADPVRRAYKKQFERSSRPNMQGGSFTHE